MFLEHRLCKGKKRQNRLSTNTAYHMATYTQGLPRTLALKRQGTAGQGSRAGRAGHRAQGTGHRAQGTGHRAQGTGHRAQGAGHRAQGTGHRAQGTGHRPGHGRAW